MELCQNFKWICLCFIYLNLIPYTLSALINSQQVYPGKALFDGPEVFITIRAEAGVVNGERLDRRMELNWNNFESRGSDDFIGLFDFDISYNPIGLNLSAMALHQVSATTVQGKSQTSIRLPRQELHPSSPQCQGFWIAYVRVTGGHTYSVRAHNCMRIYPNWMNSMNNIIGNTPIHSMMIPGTHDAGAWKHYEGIFDENVLIRYAMTQEDSIYDQLIHGIRYLDVRVAYYPASPEVFWVNHGAVRIGPLINLIQNITQFVRETQEIVLMDFHGFPVGFENRETHSLLLNFVRAEMDSLLAPKSLGPNVTPNQLWAQGRPIIWTYADDAVSSQNSFLWSNLQHAWGDKNDVDELYNYFSSTIPSRGCKGNFWSAMVELTPTAEDVILKPNLGLRGMAQMVNSNLTRWYHQESWYSKSMVVATDYYLGNNIIQMAVEANRNRAVCSV